MESINTTPSIPQLSLGAAASFNSATAPTEIIRDNKNMTGSVAVKTMKEVPSKEKRNSSERIQRSRERNRIHARKTRQRKKEQLQSLQNKAERLKREQINLKLSINEKNTANILCCLFSSNQVLQSSSAEDPKVEALLTRTEEDIPDPSKLPALQPLILPSGAQHSKRNNLNTNNDAQLQQLPNDGIDYELLGKDRSKCSPSELDQIRRERNRMHAKRTRDRKRLFMEEMAEMCKVLEGENLLLQQRLNELNGVKPNSETIAPTTKLIQPNTVSIAPVSPSLSPAITPKRDFPDTCTQESLLSRIDHCHGPEPVLPLTSQNGASFDQMKTLLDAAGVFDINSNVNLDKNKSITSSPCNVSVSSEDHTDLSARPTKKQRISLDEYGSD